ncbi:unnamed protein product [Adineta steineri]|uniref:Uncharacterized protein n=1 Tax=Adineta steineri TaxID=433720 RepID=A0A815R6T0_9BILA|nr:unnamed protein product [Adineta steineri]CAF1636491.1 unnamed protein product [Adineta steineri]
MVIFIIFGWLRNEDSSVVSRLSRLIEAVTNLSVRTTEDLQLSDVEQGDATVFPVVGDHLNQEKRSATF